MNRKNSIVSVFALSVALTACISDEPKNAEADILECRLKNDKEILMNQSDTIYKVSSIMNDILFYAAMGKDVGYCSPEFTLSEGATIDPPSGSSQDFSGGKKVSYRVTSEDGMWHRDYTLSFAFFRLPLSFSFEQFKLGSGNKYHVVYETINDVEMGNLWGSGNPGFSMASGVGPEGYPTVVVADGYQGRGMKLTTQSAGSFGAMAKMPIAPGNLFLGSFDVASALKAPLEATQFGVPFDEVPESVTGWYKYTAGPTMTDMYGKEIAGRDSFNIYAMFYENTDENGHPVVIDGANSSTNPHIVLYADIDYPVEAKEWTEFTIKFEPRNGKSIDMERLKNFGYNFSVVFSSSKAGDIFQGAVGSTLYVDEVKINCKK